MFTSILLIIVFVIFFPWAWQHKFDALKPYKSSFIPLCYPCTVANKVNTEVCINIRPQYINPQDYTGHQEMKGVE